MDIASLIGVLLGGGLLFTAILTAEGSSLGAFIDYPSMMVVIGGAFSALLISFPLKKFLALFGVAKVVFINKTPDIPKLTKMLVSLAETARRDGLLALEERISEIDDDFIVVGIQMAVDGTPPETIEELLRTEMEAVAGRHRNGKSLLEQLGRFAPAFGMIGTLMGLIIMLGNMDDPSSIGSGMAVALITTLYGAIFSNLFCLPFAEKLGFLHQQEMLSMEIVIRGISSIQAGDNPRIVEQKLNTFIPPNLRTTADENEAA